MLTEEPPYRPDAAGSDQTLHRPTAAPLGAPGPAPAATSEPGPPVAMAAARRRWWERAGLLLPLTVAAVLNVGHLSINGYGNTYYSAAVRSMSRSWHNFFFAAFDQGGFISIDKPPVSLWIQALSVRLFGWSSWSILAPAALAGTASVALLWLIVRRWFGAPAASLAALVLATTPVAVAANRVNLPDPFLIVALLGAVWCLVRGIDSRGSAWRLAAWMIGAGALVGVGFNTKMLAALIPGPALAVALLAAPASSWRRRLGRTAAFGAACVAFSVPWMLIVDAWPASSRPYVGGSSDNTVWDLVVGYNGLGRVEGQSMGGPTGAGGFGQRGPSIGGQAPAFGPGGPTANAPSSGPGAAPTGGPPANVPTQAGSQGPGRTGGPGGAGGFGGAAGGFGGGAMTGAGGIMAGSPGPFRLLSDALGGQIGWMLPLAGAGAAAAAWEHRRRGRALTQLGLWAGWATLYGTVFSLAQGTFHAYYTAALAPAIAALVGIGTVAFVRLARTERWWIVALGATGLVTALWQRTLLGRAAGFFPAAVWVMAALVAAGTAGLAVVAWRGVVRPGRAVLLPVSSFAILLGLLVGPSAWAASETANRTLNMTLPQAGPRQGSAGNSFGSNAFHGDDDLAAFLVANRGGERWDLVTGSAQTAAGYIVEDDLSVMALGGFMGTDPSLTVEGFADLVEQGQVRFVLTGSGGAGRAMGGGGGSAGSGQAASILAAASAACTAVVAGPTAGSAVTLPAAFAGQLYDCAGAAAGLRSAAG